MSEGRPPISSSPKVLTIAFLVLLIAAFAYGIHQRSQAKRLASENDQIASALKDTRSQIEALSAKLNAMTTPAQTAAPEHTKTSAVHASSHHIRRAAVHRDDPRWKQVQEQLAAHQRQLDANKQDLASTRTELSGSIARTHDELVVLERKSDRKYYEFDVNKSKEFTHDGPVGIRLKKASTKGDYADMELMVDDNKLSKKHVNLLEPVVFYAAEGGRPVELVINSISKNHIHGYVSEPKYSRSELAAMNAATTTSADASTNPPAPANRKKLELPQ